MTTLEQLLSKYQQYSGGCPEEKMKMTFFAKIFLFLFSAIVTEVLFSSAKLLGYFLFFGFDSGFFGSDGC